MISEKPLKRLQKIVFRFISPRLKSWVNKKKVRVSNRFNGLHQQLKAHLPKVIHLDLLQIVLF